MTAGSIPTYQVELSAPDISAYRESNTGIDYVHSFDSTVAGPHVMISAVVHGNEICGAIALVKMLESKLRPTRGKLTLAFMNVAAFLAFDPLYPDETRFIDEDFNRVWGESVLDGDRDSVELRRARELRPIVDEVDYLLDVHSMFTSCIPVIMAGPLLKGREFARRSGLIEHVISDQGHKAGKRLRDYAEFGDANSEKNALLIECGQHWEKSSESVAVESCYFFLDSLQMIDAKLAQQQVSIVKPQQQFIDVSGPYTIETDNFRFADAYIGMELFENKGSIIGYEGERAVTTPIDDCVLIMPSGRMVKGETAVRFGQLLRGF